MKVAREVLGRYPALRDSWPVQQARAYRERVALRQHPRRMASWYCDSPALRTRICVSNLEMPEAPDLCQPTSVVTRLFDAAGAVVAEQRHHVARNGSLVLEARDLLPVEHRRQAWSGLIQVDFEGANLGSSRAYLHWYNDHCLTSTHEKFGLTIPAVGGYWTVPNVQHTDAYRVYLAVVNLDAKPYASTIGLKDARGQATETSFELSVNGSRFFALDELFTDPAAVLGDAPGVLYFGNNDQPAMYYYFVRNDRLDTWRAQHL